MSDPIRAEDVLGDVLSATLYPDEADPQHGEDVARPPPPPPRHMITSPFPLGPDFTAYFNLPHDLTPAEAERMCLFLRSWAIPEVPPDA